MRVAKLHKDAIIPTRKHKGDAGFDLYARGTYTLTSYSWAIIHTGITIEIPKGVGGFIWPKGGSWYLIGGGVIDHTFQGEIDVKIFNANSENIIILGGSQVAQIVFTSLYDGDTWKLEEVSKDKIHKVKTLRADAGGIKTAKFTSEAKLLNDLDGYDIRRWD